MTTRASFVIPAYNAQNWISKAILSCRNQTVKKIEIIVVNDGSTDETKSIIDWHAKEDKRIFPIHLPENKGRSTARNIGNDAVNSPCILVLDADDMSSRTRVEDTLAVFEIKKPDLIYGSFFIVDGLGNVERKYLSQPFNPEEAKKTKFNYICHSTMAYKTEVAKKIKYDDGIYSKLGLDDWKFQWDAHRSGFVFRHIKTPLSYYRRNPSGISANRSNEEVLKAKEEYLAV